MVLNKKEMFDLIFTSLYSNDYISRTITIKIICQLAEFFQERFDIFHQVPFIFIFLTLNLLSFHNYFYQ